MASTENLSASKLFSTKDLVCVVTGGGTGLGLMAAQTLAANGSKVYIVGRREEALERAAKAHDPKTGGQIIPCSPCDVTDKSQLEKLIEEISKKEQRVDLLVAAAGVPGPKASPEFEEAEELKARLWDHETVEEWNQTYSTNVTGVYFTCVSFLPLLQAATQTHGQNFPSVIVISSMSGIMRHAQGHFSYNASKGGTIQLTKLMSAEFLKVGIRVNSIAPGYFPSEMTVKESDSDQKSYMSSEKVQKTGHVPAQRPGTDEEMAQAVLFLARNLYVNGEILAVDGGVLNVVAGR